MKLSTGLNRVDWEKALKNYGPTLEGPQTPQKHPRFLSRAKPRHSGDQAHTVTVAKILSTSCPLLQINTSDAQSDFSFIYFCPFKYI